MARTGSQLHRGEKGKWSKEFPVRENPGTVICSSCKFPVSKNIAIFAVNLSDFSNTVSLMNLSLISVIGTWKITSKPGKTQGICRKDL